MRKLMIETETWSMMMSAHARGDDQGTLEAERLRDPLGVFIGEHDHQGEIKDRPLGLVDRLEDRAVAEESAVLESITRLPASKFAFTISIHNHNQ